MGSTRVIRQILESELSWCTERGGKLPVRDKDGNLSEVITPERLAMALDGNKTNVCAPTPVTITPMTCIVGYRARFSLPDNLPSLALLPEHNHSRLNGFIAALY